MNYTELQVTTNFSFLRGASHPQEMINHAAELGYSSIAITDHNTLAGIVRAHVAAKKFNMKFIPGCRLNLVDGPSLLAYPTDVKAYARLSALLTKGNLRTIKGKCELYKQDVYEHAEGLKFIAISPSTLNRRFDFDDSFKEQLTEYRDVLGYEVSLSASKSYNGVDAKLLYRVHELSKKLNLRMVATNDVHYHDSNRRELQDIVTCVREKLTIHNAGYKLHANAERYLKDNAEMIRLFRQYPDAIRQTQVIAEACTFSLEELSYEYPKEISAEGWTPDEALRHHTWEGANKLFDNNIPDKVSSAIEYELKFIKEIGYAKYFLTVYGLVVIARELKILCQGRGSAANSTVCYCLGITSVDPSKFDLLFERFISSARNEPPDIDVDFEHERREEVMQYIYEKYGRDRAAIVATVTQQHHRGAIKDVGRAMGLSEDTIKAMGGLIWEFSNEGFDHKRIKDQGLNPDDPLVVKVLQLTSQFIGFPRQLGQHTGGFVITESKLSDLCPVFNARMKNRTNIEWNKDDIDALKFLKIDVLSLGMLTCIRKAFNLVQQHYNKEFTLANIPPDDPAVYEMVTEADTIGVFQIESRAQQNMLPQMKPKCFYDLVIEVAIVRPGPIQGDMVHPYIRRRNGEEAITYPSKELEEILGRTLGVPLFQEQAMKIAIVAAGFTPAEADELRRSMATFKFKGMVSSFQQKLISGMTRNGYTEEYAMRVFKQLEGFGSYGFPESHAVSFALLVYVSCYLKCYYPEVFTCAILNSMPMGFYQPAQLVGDARDHGVEVRPVDINFSDWDNKLEERSGKYHALRLGFRQIRGIREVDIIKLIRAREGSYTSIQQLRDAGLSDAVLEKLADADAFRSIGYDRRNALWNVSTQDYQPQTLFADQQINEVYEKHVKLPEMRESEHVVHDYASVSLSLKAHPISFIRDELTRLKIVSTIGLKDVQHGDFVNVAGLILVRQRPGTAKGVCFITIEDETGIANLVVFNNMFDKYRKEVIKAKLLMVHGKVEKKGKVIHVIVSKCVDLSRLLGKLSISKEDELNLSPRSRSDETTSPVGKNDQNVTGHQKGTQGEIFPEARNFR